MREQEQRHAYYDRDLQIEAYRLSGIVQKFPNHFHEYYVIGFIEGGKRRLCCKNEEYDLAQGDLILFNPRDSHYCAPIDGEILDYRAVNIAGEVMAKTVVEITGRTYTPYFMRNVVFQSGIAPSIGSVYDAIVNCAQKLEKEEAYFFLMEQILAYAVPYEEAEDRLGGELSMLCAHMEAHYEENITLDELSTMSGLSKYYLLRSFARQFGVSPYRYLQSIRIERAKRLLEKGTMPIDAAFQTGFSDQSHFSNYFKEFIGLTPKQYRKIFGVQTN